MLTKKLEKNQCMIVHITNAMSDDTEVEIHYSPKMEACDASAFAPIRRQGEILVLSPANTPIVLELAGMYKFEPTVSDSGAQLQTEYVENTRLHGDIMSQSVYTTDKDVADE